MKDLIIADTHCHLDLAQFDEDRDAILARATAAGVGLIVNPGIDLAHSRAALALADRYPMVYAAVGVHPNSSATFDEKTLDEVRALAAHPKAVAIGEIGLDYYWKDVPPAQQVQAFEAQLDLAAELGLPVIIHSREANEDVAQTLRSWVAGPNFQQSTLAQRPYAGVLHAFSGDLELAQEAYNWGFVLSLGGPVTFKNAHALHQLVRGLDPLRLMLETDAPYLTPHPHRGTRNEPAYIPLILEQLAELSGMRPDLLAQASSELALRFFDLEDAYRVSHAAVHQATSL